MHIELMVFLGWASVPVVAYGVGMAALRRSAGRPDERSATDATARLEELRRRPVEGGVTRGRLAEATRLADGPVAASLTHGRG